VNPFDEKPSIGLTKIIMMYFALQQRTDPVVRLYGKLFGAVDFTLPMGLNNEITVVNPSIDFR